MHHNKGRKPNIICGPTSSRDHDQSLRTSGSEPQPHKDQEEALKKKGVAEKLKKKQKNTTGAGQKNNWKRK